MSIKNFTIIKKNRVYFAAEIESGHECKIVIDDASKHLEPGQSYDLFVDDISVRSKYGTDLKFRVKSDVKKEKKIVTLVHDRYNSDLVFKCRRLGGQYSEDQNAWIFSEIVEAEVEELEYRFNSKLVTIRLIFNSSHSAYRDSLEFLGYTLARAFSRDSGAKLGDNISLIKGSVYSGGSMKNWYTGISEGSEIAMEVPEVLLDMYEKDQAALPEDERSDWLEIKRV